MTQVPVALVSSNDLVKPRSMYSEYVTKGFIVGKIIDKANIF